ncbi:autotransporter-associated beta strand repeat-containing protein [Sphingomonas sp. T9W2]|uniref:beta strand repeat-containing protein n=1 Tax=Sphingomonas sp. T9W2 TaxID=3143183 RepID=UPI0031F51E5B
MAATDAHAACVRSAGSVTCTVPTNNGDGVIGPSAGGTTITTVTVGDGTTEGTFDSNGTAISLGDNTHITINAKATVHSHSGGPALNGHPTGTGPQGIGANTIEVGNNSLIDIYGIVQSDALGLGRTGQGDEVINPTGNGNTINIYQGGKIATLNDSGPTIWFQNLAGANTLANTITNNGTIQAGTSGNGAVIGSGGNVAVNFTNGETGVVNGNLSLGSGANSITLNGGSQFNGSMSMGSGDDLLQFYKGATFTGTINGGGGTNELRLLGNASDPGPSSIIPGSLFNFSRIIKDGTSTWTISGSLSGLGSNTPTISVDGGTLLLSGNNDGFLGSTTITAGGTLQIGAGGTAGTLPGAITNNGVLALNRSDALTVAGAITGGGVVQQIGGGTTTLTGALSGGSIVANAGTIALGAAGTLTTDGVQLVPGGTIQAVELTAGGTFSNAGTITVGGLISDGIHLQGGTFNNTGSVIAPNNVRSGVYAQLGGTITNTGTGLISGGYGIYASTGTNDITVSGNGAVTGTSYIGIHADTTSGNITLGTSAAPLGTVTGGGGHAIDVAVSGSGAIALTADTVVGASRGISATTTGAGSLVDSANAAASPVAGSYRLFNYGGALGGTFATITSPSAQTYNVFTDIPGQVNLLVSNGGQALQFWDGTDTTGAGPGGQGGTATWNAGNTNWTGGPASVINTGWLSGVGIFGGTAGTVTLASMPDMQGLQFTVDGYGYRLIGSSLNLTGDPFSTPGQSFVNVDGGVGATIDSALTSTGGSFGLNKIGAGTLILTGANSYGGATSVTAGTLVLGAGGSLVSAVSVAGGASFQNAGTLAAGLNNAGTADNTGTIGAPVSNSGDFTTSGILTSGLTNSGTVIASGGRIDGAVVNQAGNLTISGFVTGNATLANAAAAAVTVTNTGSYRLTGLLDNAGNLTNAGTFRGDVSNAAGATVTNSGTLTTATQRFQNAGLLVSTGTLEGGLANSGTMQLSGTLTGEVANTGNLFVTGPVTGIGALTNDGLVDLGGTTLNLGALQQRRGTAQRPARHWCGRHHHRLCRYHR